MISEDGRTDPENSEEEAEAGGGGGDEPQLQLKILFIDWRTHTKKHSFLFSIMSVKSYEFNPWEIVFCSETNKRNNLNVTWGKEISFSS